MRNLMATMINDYRDLMDNKSDQRVMEWPLMSGPLPTFLICSSYVCMAKVVGPRLMRDRKPLHLNGLLVSYNLFQVMFSLWIYHEMMMGGWWDRYSFRCQPVDYSNDPVALRMARACWWYYFSKFTEFIDTLFFILRKKNEQITTLHVIHHSVMPMSVWFGVKFTPGGHSSFFGLLNTFVHVVMYTYYMLAAMGPKVRRYLWWKKYLTVFQMVQFVLMMVHAFQLLFIECDYPRCFAWFIGMHALVFYFLFTDFYKQAYKNNVKHKKDDNYNGAVSVLSSSKGEEQNLTSGLNNWWKLLFRQSHSKHGVVKKTYCIKEKEIEQDLIKQSEVSYWGQISVNVSMLCIPDQTALSQNRKLQIHAYS